MFKSILNNITATRAGAGALVGAGALYGLYNYSQGGMASEKALSKDLTGINYIVTGANAGIGFETAQQLVKQNAKVILACRSEKKGVEAIARIKEELGGKFERNMEFMKLDLSDQKQIKEFVKEIETRQIEVGGLINNAGVMHIPHSVTKDGFEYQMGVNHFGHFTLTILLLNNIIRNDARIVNVSSMAHNMGSKKLRWDHFEDACTHIGVTELYSQSKLANILFSKALDREIRKVYPNWKGAVVSLHPGVIRTSLMRHYGGFIQMLQAYVFVPLTKSPWSGCQTTLHCALEDNIVGGAYYHDAAVRDPIPFAQDKKNQNRFFDLSFRVTKIENPL